MNSKSLIVTIVIILVIVFVAWYLYSNFFQQSYNIQSGVNYDSDTTGSISNDLNQLPNDSSVNSEMNSLDQNVNDF